MWVNTVLTLECGCKRELKAEPVHEPRDPISCQVHGKTTVKRVSVSRTK